MLKQDEIDFAELENKRVVASGDPSPSQSETPPSKNVTTKPNFLKKMMSGSTTNRVVGIKDDFDVKMSTRSSLRVNQNLVELSDLVKRPSKDLPEVLPYNKESSKRSVSAGVASMREGLFSRKSLLAAEALDGKALPQSQDPTPLSLFPISASPADENNAPGNRLRSMRKKAVSTGVFLMQSERSHSFLDADKAENKAMVQCLALSAAANESEMQPIVNKFNEKHSEAKEDTNSKAIPISLKQKKSSIGSILEHECVAEHDSDSDDDRSDVVPAITGIDKLESTKTRKEFRVWLEHLFMKKSYRQASAVFGTMVAFFMIAIRIELILLDTCFIYGELSFRCLCHHIIGLSNEIPSAT